MPISNYPSGFAQGVAIRGLPILNTYGGNIYWVDSNAGHGDTGNGAHNRPWATFDYALGKYTANHGDIIVLKAGHAETVATAAAIAADIDGVEVICLGEGADRPTFTFSAVDATMVISAASFTMKNFIVKPSIDSVVSPIVIQAPDCDLDFELQDESATVECVRAILTTAAADRLNVNLNYRGFIAGGACDNAIRLVGVDTARINVDFYGVADVAIVEFHTTACHDIDILGKFYNDGTSLTKNVVDSATGSTWSCQGWDGNSNANFSGGDNAALASDDTTPLVAAVEVIDEFHDVPAKDNVLNAQINEVLGNKTDTTAADAVTETDTIVGYIKQLVTLAIARDTALGVVDDLHDVPIADAATNLYMRDVIGIKTDAAAADAVSNVESLMAYVKQAITLAIARDTAIGVIDGLHDVPTADVATNAFMRDVVGIKTDAAINAVTTTKTLMAYLKGVLNEITVPAQNNTDNAFINDVMGQKTDAAAVGAVTTTDTLVGYIKQLIEMIEQGASSATAVIVDGDTLFTIAGGPIQVEALMSVCVTGNSATASTLQYSQNPTDGAATTFSGASASLASALAGASVVLQGTTLSTAPALNASGAGINASGGISIILQAGIVTAVVGVGSTTGTWKHYIRYKPLASGVTVS